jgi:hypothetical protein
MKISRDGYRYAPLRAQSFAAEQCGLLDYVVDLCGQGFKRKIFCTAPYRQPVRAVASMSRCAVFNINDTDDDTDAWDKNDHALR